MKYELIREKRKTISMRVEPNGQIVVKAPIKAPIAFIEQFILSKQNWIAKQLKRVESVNSFKNSFDFSSYFYILGQKCNFAEVDMALIGATQKQIWKHYNKMAAELLPDMVGKKVEEVGLEYRTLKISNSRRVWGSFDRNGNMKLNYKLVILPPELVNYVIVHELCHGKYLNHSKQFWAKVGDFCPEYKKLKKQLEMYSFLLEI